MIKKHPNTVLIDRCNHWAVGWVEYLTVKMIDKNGRITRAGIDVLDWLERLDDYPVANEDHYNELEYTENYDNALESIRSETYRADLIDNLPDNWRGLVYEWLHDNNMQAIEDSECGGSDGWLDQDSIIEACRALGYIEAEESES